MISYHPDTAPACGQQRSNAFRNLCEQRINVLSQLPAARMPFAVDIAKFTPGVALSITVIGTAKIPYQTN